MTTQPQHAHDAAQDLRETGISFVIPCFNENPDALKQSIDALNAAMQEAGHGAYEIIVVDDGSTRCRYDAEHTQGAALIVHERNYGYGASLMSGIERARYDWIGIVDADLTYPIAQFKEFLAHMSACDMIVGKRQFADMSLMRRFPKFILQKTASFFAKYPIPDLNSGMRLFKKQIVLQYKRIFPYRFSFTSTLTMICLTNFYKVHFIAIAYYKRVGLSNIRPIHDTIRFFSLILRLTLYFRPLRFFIPLSMLALLAAVLRGLRDVLLHNQFGGLTLVLFFMAFQIFFFGLLAEIINKK